MKLQLARGLFLILAAVTTALGAAVVWTQPTAFAYDERALYAVPGAGLLIALVGFVACFAPFDRPQSAPRWAAPLSGLSVGIALAGLVWFTPSFLWLAGPLLIYAVLLHLLSRVVHEGPPDLELGTGGPGMEEPPLPARPPPPTGVWPLIVVFALVGCWLTWAWRPSEDGVRALGALESDVASIISRPAVQVRTLRIKRKTDLVEISGNDVLVEIGLRRPRLRITVRNQELFLEPCLNLEQATVDGFLWLPGLNDYQLEPTGLALVELAEGYSKAWVRVEYPQGRARYSEMAGTVPSFGRRAGAEDISAVIEVEVDLDSGRVVLDAVTRLKKPAAVRAASLGFVQLTNVSARPLIFGLGAGGEGMAFLPQERTASAPPKQLEFLASEGDVVRLLRAKSGDEGPYETVEVGPFESWVVLPGRGEPLLLVAPDWHAQASIRSSRTAGYGLPENSLQFWYEDARINLLFDLASTRIGPGRLVTRLPPGVYRNRLVLQPLRGHSAPALAQAELMRLTPPPPPPAETRSAPPPPETHTDRPGPGKRP